MFGWLRSLNPFARPETRSGGGPPRIRARYENATTTSENQRLWWGADALSPKAANSYWVRRQLRTRSRHEVANNPYLWGIANGNADDFTGTSGPTLQVRTADAGYNRAVEQAWAAWCAEVELVEKLRTLKLARTVDGEGFLILKTAADLDHPVKLYPVDVEADQVTSPAPANLAEQWVDGLTLHPVTGRPTHFHVLRHHPGDFFFPDLNPLAVDKLAARWVIHWFPKFRPGQVRGVPVFTPSLDLFAELRAFRKATLGAAEIAADYAAVMEQDKETGAFDTEDDGDDEYKPFSRVPLLRKMMTVMPPGGRLNQLKPEHPTTTYEMFSTACVGEAVRPLSYPLMLALGTSAKFNFSSAKLDFTNYRNALTVERGQCAAGPLDRLFAPWHEEAVLAGAVPVPPSGKLTPPPHEWHWPGFESLDPLVDAQTDAARIAAGGDTLREFWARRGKDWRDVLAQLKAEKDELERLGLAFGDVVQRTVSETQTQDATTEPANAA